MSRRSNAPVVRVAIALAATFLIVASSGAGGAFAAGSGPFSKTESISRVHLVNGADQVVDQRTFHVSVDVTTHLRDRQGINVDWTGAHPTGGLVGDQNSGLAGQQEYPVVLMECRGVDSSSIAVAQRLTPETCWTHTPAERNQNTQAFNFPSYRLDRYATTADRGSFVGVPSPIPSACASYTNGIQHWIPFRAADKKIYYGGPLGCAGMAPEAVNFESSLQPSNTTYGATDTSGNGSAKFIISTAETNASLGCSDKVPCSLVIIPIMGISCDPAANGLPQDVQDKASAICSATGQYAPGEYNPGTIDGEDLAVSGYLWWSASNWRNRISVPLNFAPPANICGLVSKTAPLYVYGSEMMSQATEQWSPHFCLDPKLFKLQHVQTAEPQAKNLLANGSVEAALQGAPPQSPFGRPVVQAPVALTGFAITYAIDDHSGHEFKKLKMTPRLLAKLLTESYAGLSKVQADDPQLSNNPISMAVDPEFRALNPGPPNPAYNTAPAATLFTVSSDSDVIWALTSYINSDPEARAWLNGQADPWGMVVNPAYKKIKLPVTGWPLLDTFHSGSLYTADGNPCLNANPVPILPLIAAPVAQMAVVTLNMQFGIANSQIVCQNAGQINEKLVATGRENPGQRFIVGLTSLADAERYQLDSAALLTHVASNAPVKFTDATGRTFVTPNDASLRAAAGMLKPNDTIGTWPIPYQQMRTGAAGAGAYPGTMLMSLDVPTSGLPTKDAQRYAQVLRFAAGPGQVRGSGNGQLPLGYLPMTAANGMGSLAKYTLAAADAVAAQSGGITSVTTLQTPGVGGGVAPGPTTGPVSAPPAPSVIPTPTTTPPPPRPPTVVAALLRMLGLGGGLVGWAGLTFPLVLIVGVGCAFAAAATWLVNRRRVRVKV
jgi:hypothetical protein